MTKWELVNPLGGCTRTISSDLQIGVRGQVLKSVHAHFENFRPPNLKRNCSVRKTCTRSRPLTAT